jgi:hypothetical protein
MKINLFLSPTERECSIISVRVEDASSIHYAVPNISIPAGHRIDSVGSAGVRSSISSLVEEMRLGSASRASRFLLTA